MKLHAIIVAALMLLTSCRTKQTITASENLSVIDSLVNAATLRTFSQFNARNITIRIDSMDLTPLEIKPCQIQSQKPSKAYGINIQIADTTATQASEQTTNDIHLLQLTAKKDTTATTIEASTSSPVTNFIDHLAVLVTAACILVLAVFLFKRNR